MRFIKSIIIIAIVYGAINGGLWAYYQNAHADEHAEMDELGSWLDDTEVELQYLEDRANNAETEEEYNEIYDKYSALLDDYNSTVDEYNEMADGLDEYYLIPIPTGHRE